MLVMVKSGYISDKDIEEKKKRERRVQNLV